MKATPKNYFAINMPCPGSYFNERPLPKPGDPGTEAILHRTTARLALWPKALVRHRSGCSFVVTESAHSPLTPEALRTAMHIAGLYNPYPPMGRALSADRIQRLVLGVAELLQAEVLDDPAYDGEQIEAELQAVARCLIKGLQETSDDQPDPERVSDGDDHDNGDEIDDKGDNDDQ